VGLDHVALTLAEQKQRGKQMVGPTALSTFRLAIGILPLRQIWDVPASAKTEMGPEIVKETSCALLLLDLDDRNSFRVAKRWRALIAEGEVMLSKLSTVFSVKSCRYVDCRYLGSHKKQVYA